MANQAIALQARAPNVDPLGGAIRNNAQMINMMTQQQAAQRQTAVAEQNMRLQQAQEARAGAKEGREATAAQVELAKNVAANFKNELTFLTPGDVQGATALRNSVVQTIPGWNAILPTPEAIANDPTTRQRLMMKADEIIAYTVPKPTSSISYGAGGAAFDVTHGGLGSPIARRVMVAPAGSSTPMPAPAAVAPPMATSQADQDAEGILRSAASAKTITADEAARVRASLGPNGGAKFNSWLQQNNIDILPSRGGGVPLQRTVAPETGRESKLLEENEIGTQFRGRDPMQSPLPGSAQVPIRRVRAEAIAGRETPAEAAAKAKAVAAANAAAEFEKKNAEKLPARKQVSTLISKVRGAYEALERQKAIVSEKRGTIANMMDYMGSSTLGREVQKAVGTSSSKYLSEIVNSRKLLATAIKNATGMSAQEMNSNTELQLTLDALTDPTQGIEAARSTLDTLESLYGTPQGAPRASGGKPSSAPKRLKYNPSTGGFD